MYVRGGLCAALIALSGCSGGQILQSRDPALADGAAAGEVDAGDAATGLDGAQASRCGDGVRDPGEICDDANSASGDGCSGDCRQIEPAFVCPSPGVSCTYTALCGDQQVAGREQCDDGNTGPGDGCDARCLLEPGYACRIAGTMCRAARCGDLLQVGSEACDDGNDRAGDGCDQRCRLEPGFACPPGAGCRPTACGDGRVEPGEHCDDGNALPYDGCFQCQREPSCANDACAAVCGDGLKFPSEACDDGNARAGDGCSGACALEAGFACAAGSAAAPETLAIPVIFRDLRGADSAPIEAQNIAAGHPDFESRGGSVEQGIVAPLLGADKKPIYAPPDGSSLSTTSADNFQAWYHDDPRFNRTVVDQLPFARVASGSYVFESAEFFPIDQRGFAAEGVEPLRLGHNFHFTSELRYWFVYQGGETLEFLGDDDLWVFVNGRLALDLGGAHAAAAGTVTLGPENAAGFGLSPGGVYEVVVFHAERHTDRSQYKLTLRGFERSTTGCQSVCGDKVVTPDEVCDDGKNDGSYGSCTPDCQDAGPHCGDGIVQRPAGEECDDGNRKADDGCDNSCRAAIVI